jgi:hypothetical protein
VAWHSPGWIASNGLGQRKVTQLVDRLAYGKYGHVGSPIQRAATCMYTRQTGNWPSTKNTDELLFQSRGIARAPVKAKSVIQWSFSLVSASFQPERM